MGDVKRRAPHPGRSEGARLVDPTNLVGPIEIAARLKVATGTVRAWKSRGKLPSPLAVVSGTPVWSWPDVKEWLGA